MGKKSLLNKLYRTLKKHRKQFILFLLVISLLLVTFSFFAPYLLSKYSIYDLSEANQIGDALNGLMSPFLMLAGIILAGLAFYMQYEANDELKKQFTLVNNLLCFGIIEESGSTVSNFNKGNHVGILYYYL